MRASGGVAVLFDFSGTLSLGAIRFARPQNLARALRDSGLFALGVDARNFWSELINPAWPEGSTTAIGYRRLLVDGVRRLAAARGLSPAPEQVRAAASRFTAAYLRHSAIDPEWIPLLRRLAGREAMVVATDHYAEATAQIIARLAGLGLEAAPAPQAQPGKILVANSADLGVLKENPAFWESLRRSPALPQLRAAVLVDDFGYNEQAADSYGAAEKVAARRLKTVQAIETAWRLPVAVFPFLVHRPGDFPALVTKASQFVLERLSLPSGSMGTDGSR